ncbi:MAG: hypothetical protein C0511_04515 [Hyphomicrobium sp.]|nr:hypothetical protein [Hyphomicrobium sp.]PPC82999.1 MAG: hypothetical protein CTY40_03385 [Hyphomicrobium sp.]
MRHRSSAAIVMFLFSCIASTAAATAEPLKVAFFGIRFNNTSQEPTRPDEVLRIKQADDFFIEKLSGSGRFVVVQPDAAMQKDIAARPNIGECNGCELDFSKALGAKRLVYGEIQKVSNLILNLNIYWGDVDTGKLTFVKSVDLRGNTDEGWRASLNYLMKNYLLDEVK